jgi:hypothetical protein
MRGQRRWRLDQVAAPLQVLLLLETLLLLLRGRTLTGRLTGSLQQHWCGRPATASHSKQKSTDHTRAVSHLPSPATHSKSTVRMMAEACKAVTAQRNNSTETARGQSTATTAPVRHQLTHALQLCQQQLLLPLLLPQALQQPRTVSPKMHP